MAETKNDGGPAFPFDTQIAPPGYAANYNRPASSGMSLRDYFMTHYMAALATSGGGDETFSGCARGAKLAFNAMLMECEK